ncbi:winged helix DNA-binding domain-containing protein [Streptomyces sp. SID13031]|uniref:winged helix DNA-binding domain-containing protein n=1 Tax=Streptomyces sp. SID13031 TaxID=2706046 RepID=UPI0013CCF1D8|nr:winged helix DNA-binding domain-containing protein [Streptomyces sp. SID13031]NEA36007.1 winged helix DNA-binding domain-containing protein [Streptomyces sp. SID13031]
MTVLSPRAINRATLARQLLLERSDLSVAQAVERLAGMQGQEPKHPYVGLWSRLSDFADADLTAAAAAREVVRATLFRGTLHLVTAEDYLRFRTTLNPVLEAGLKLLGDRAAGLEPEKVAAAARQLLAVEPLTFTEVRDALQAQFPEVNYRALGFCTRMMVPLIISPAETRWGWTANARFTPAEQWIGKKLRRSAAPEELVVRYLEAFGPAGPADFQTWSGLPRAKQLFDSMDLEVFTDESGKTLYDVPGAPRPSEDTVAPVRFLPEFDNLLLAHAKRQRIIADEYRPAVFTKNLRVKSTYLVDGLVAGMWTAEMKRGVATLTLTPFGRTLKKTATELEREGTALLRFLEPDAKTYELVTAS